MRYLSMFSGIEAASCAWQPLGWTPVGFCEVDPFASAVLAYHHPDVPNLGSVTDVSRETLAPLGDIDLAVFGWPCQDLSVAGKRAGLAGERSGLFYEAIRILRLAAERGCGWFVAENVPGLLSSHGGRDFAEVIREITGLTFPVPGDGWGNGGVVGGNDGGWSLAWRVLDAQFFGVPQRRRRVFVVGRLGDWRGPAAVLFERHSLSGDPPPRRKAREIVAGTLTSSLGRRCGQPDGGDTEGHLIARTLTAHPSGRYDGDTETFVPEVAFAVKTQARRIGQGWNDTMVAHTLRGEGFDASEDGTGRGTPLVPVAVQEDNQNGVTIRDTTGSLRADAPGTQPCGSLIFERPAIAFNPQAGGKQTSLGYEPGSQTTGTLSVCQTPAIATPAHGDTAFCLPASSRGTGDGHGQGWNSNYLIEKSSHANAYEIRSSEVLRAVREKIGEEAFQEWGLGVATSFLSPEVLRSLVHGGQLRLPASLGESVLLHGAPSREKTCPSGSMPEVWRFGCLRRPPREHGLGGQLHDELGAYLSELPPEGAPEVNGLQALWIASEGLGLLREALSAIQEARRPPRRETQPAQPRSAVRRLTPLEAERLQGFPDHYTAVPYRGKPASDGPRYKALGNSMAVPCMAWIGRRINAVRAVLEANR